MNNGDESDWADLAEELGIEAKPKPKPKASVIGQEIPEQGSLFPSQPWPEQPRSNQQRSNDEPLPFNEEFDSPSERSFVDLPDVEESFDDHDTLIDAQLSTEEFATDLPNDEENENADSGETDENGKKRRRRRRRKKGAPGVAPSNQTPNQSANQALGDVKETAEIPAEPRSTADAIRNLVASWNVPSWNEIVGGLYRPGGSNNNNNH